MIILHLYIHISACRYVNPLPETRENKPNPELEAERAETAASQASAAAGFVAAGFGSGLQGFNTASSQVNWGISFF